VRSHGGGRFSGLGADGVCVHRHCVSVAVHAARHRGLLGVAITALLYNFGGFILVGFTPFPLGIGAHQIGLIFFGWGVTVAIASVVVAPRLQHRSARCLRSG
jgi:MFS transporter, ACDE family, multidrug resistance protein